MLLMILYIQISTDAILPGGTDIFRALLYDAVVHIKARVRSSRRAISIETRCMEITQERGCGCVLVMNVTTVLAIDY